MLHWRHYSWLPSSCPRSRGAAPSWCARSYASAARATGGHDGGDAAIAADVHQSLDVHRDFGTKRAFDLTPLDHLTEPVRLRRRRDRAPAYRGSTPSPQDPAAGRASDAEDVGQSDLNPLLARKIDASDSCHSLSALTLLVLGIALADDANHALALDDLAVLANRLDAAADFHRNTIDAKRGDFPAKSLSIIGPVSSRKAKT